MIAVQRLPFVHLNRPAASLVGAVAMVVFGVLSLPDAYAAIDFDVLVFLRGMMLIVGYLEVGKFFEWAADKVLRHARTPERLLFDRSGRVDRPPRARRGSGRSSWRVATVVSGILTALSNLISNVPAVILWRNTVPNLPNPDLLWRVLAMSSTLIALLATLVGAAPCAAQDRWQLTLNSGQYLWDLRLVKLDGAALVVRQADTTVTVPVSDISELRLVAKSVKQTGRDDGGRAVFNALSGAGDEVYTLTLADLPERLGVIRNVLRVHPPTPVR